MRIEVAGPVGKLVGELEEPASDPRGAALVCHPHPVHGGSLRNTIVVRTARALREAGLVTLRLNFRGVEGSQGRYDGAQEIEDAAAALGTLAARYSGVPLWAAGYSFGSRIVAELALREGAVERLILIAFPCREYDAGSLTRVRQPGLIVLGQVDPFGNARDLRRALPELPEGLELVEIPGADHFFRGRTPLVEEAVRRYARASLERAGSPPRKEPER